MFKRILLIVGGCLLVVTAVIFLIYKTCSITYLTDKIYSPDKTYFIHAQSTECVLLDRYTVDVIITRVNHSFLEKLNGSSSEDVLILKGMSPVVTPFWESDRTLKVQYSNCRGIYGQHKAWRDINIKYGGSCSEDS